MKILFGVPDIVVSSFFGEGNYISISFAIPQEIALILFGDISRRSIEIKIISDEQYQKWQEGLQKVQELKLKHPYCLEALDVRYKVIKGNKAKLPQGLEIFGSNIDFHLRNEKEKADILLQNCQGIDPSILLTLRSWNHSLTFLPNELLQLGVLNDGKKVVLKMKFDPPEIFTAIQTNG